MISKETIDHNPVSEPFMTVDGFMVCGYCGKKYKLVGAMKRHLEKNHGATGSVMYTCSKCEKPFDTKKQLTRHERMKGDCTKNI